MELKPITIEQLEKINSNHALIIVSNGKMKIAELPAYGEVEIQCHEKRVKRVKQTKATTF